MQFPSPAPDLLNQTPGGGSGNLFLQSLHMFLMHAPVYEPHFKNLVAHLGVFRKVNLIPPPPY